MVRILQGDALVLLRLLPDASVHCCITSPPYWGLRDYGCAGQFGLEKTPEEYTSKLVETFREVRRVLRDNGTLWLNLGDSYASSPKGNSNGQDKSTLTSTQTQEHSPIGINKLSSGLKPKDLVGIPWRVAFALQADGWYLRQDIIWAKPNPMPESVRDRCTRAHEYVFMLSKNARYYYDAEAVKWQGSAATIARLSQKTFDTQTGGPKDPLSGNRSCRKALVNLHDKQRGHSRRHAGLNDRWDHMSKQEQCVLKCNARSVWSVATVPYKEAHFATFPPGLIKPMVLAGCPDGGTVLDPFAGSGTTGMVAENLGRNSILIELNPRYIELIKERTKRAGMQMAATE